MNWVDLTIVAVLIFFALEGLGKPLLFEIFDLISFVLAFAFSLRFYNQVAKLLENNFSLPHSFANVLGFIAIWYLSETLLFLLARTFIFKPLRTLKIPLLNGLSVIPSFLKGLIFVATILILVGTFPIQPQIKSAVNSSKLGLLILSQSYQLETPLKNVFGGLANDSLTFLTIEPKTNENVNLGFRTNKFFFDRTLEPAMIDLVNKERVSRGLDALTFDPKLQEIAREHSAGMFSRGYFSHYSPEGKTVADRAAAAGINYLVIGENLAYAPSLSLAHNGLMNSPGHRANILSTDYHKIGIGIANGGDFGIMFTQVFTN